ncbi:MAG: M23 family metallopeptidase [Propionibacterium sp.]|nr:M23 family metallopeptidase [Propionibacterium sp.]
MADRKLGVAALIAAPVVVLGGALGGLLLLSNPSAACNPASSLSVSVRDAGAPQPAIDGYSSVQLANAADIINAGATLDLGVRDQTIAVMTAMGESALTVADHGDQAGPDSRGLFQQRDNGAWGTLADRMDPTTSATNFFKALQRVSGRDSLAPTIVANKVQRNADPYYYAKFWGPAVAVIEGLTGTSTGMANDAGEAVCTTTRGAPGVVDAQGWADPATGPITSPYGWRVHPVYGDLRLHAGDDIGAACGAPIWAASAGIVTAAGPADGYGNLIEIDHGGGLTTRYAHMFTSGVLVRVGDHVTAGQNIATVGKSGDATGCHLHFEVRQAGATVDPQTFMAAAGITLGQ